MALVLFSFWAIGCFNFFLIQGFHGGPVVEQLGGGTALGVGDLDAPHDAGQLADPSLLVQGGDCRLHPAIPHTPSPAAT